MEQNPAENRFSARASPRGGDQPGEEAEATTSTKGIKETNNLDHSQSCRSSCNDPPCHITIVKNCFNKRLSYVDIGDGYNTSGDTVKSSWKAGTFHNKLGVSYKGSMGVGHGKGLRDRIHRPTVSDKETTPQSIQCRSAAADCKGNHRPLQKRGGDRSLDPSQGRVLLNTISGSKEGRRPETGDQPKEPQLICRGAPFQNGGYTHTQKPGGGERLVSKNRSQGRLLLCPNLPGTQKIPLFSSRRQTLSLQLPPLWPNIGPMGLYQDPETSSSSRTGAGDAIGGLYRRHTPDGRVRGESSRPSGRHDLPTRMPGLHNKYREDCHSSDTNTRLSRFHREHSDHGVNSPAWKNKENTGGVPKTFGGGAGIGSCTFQTNREDERGKSGNTTGPAVLQAPSNGDDSGPETVRSGLRGIPATIPREQGRVDLVGYQNDKLEWKDNHFIRARSSDRIGCLETGLGGLLSGHQHRGTVDSRGEKLAYKLPRTASSHTSPENIHKEANTPISTPQDRQHYGSSVHKQPWRNGVQATGNTVSGAMDVVSGEKHPYPGTISTGRNEPDSGPGVEMHERSVGLEVGPSDLWEDQRTLWPTGSGHVRLQTHQSVPSLLQLAARSVCRGNRCFPTNVVGLQGLCKPPMEPNPQGPQESPESGSRRHASSTSLENPAMVCAADNHVGGLATPSTSATPPRVVSGNSRMEHLRESLAGQGLSSQATELVMGSWRSKTNKSYNSLFGRWDRWCSERGSDPFSGPVTDVANFLASLFQEGYQYNSVNAYRSAISSVHKKVDGLPVGQHPLVTRLLKGVFNLRPPTPRYSSTWDVQQVLNYLGALGKAETLSLKHLSLKTVFLLAVTRPSRSADLSQLDATKVRFENSGMSFTPTSLAKQSRQGKPITDFYFPSFSSNPSLCPVATVRQYIATTQPLRGTETKLFISYIKPHKPVTSSTIARWLRATLDQAGIDSTVFGAHSTRGASASAAARGGVTTEDILRAANWSSESVFQKFYHKEVDRAAYGRAVISSVQSE